MKLSEIRTTLEATPAWECVRADRANREVGSCHASDLISDLLACQGSDALLLTGLANAQVMRTAEILDFAAICLVRGKQPQPAMLSQAREKGIPVLTTELSMYECCGRLYREGLPAGIRMEGASACRP